MPTGCLELVELGVKQYGAGARGLVGHPFLIQPARQARGTSGRVEGKRVFAQRCMSPIFKGSVSDLKCVSTNTTGTQATPQSPTQHT